MASIRSVVIVGFAALLLVLSTLTTRSAASAVEVVRLSSDSVVRVSADSIIALQTPPFIQVGKRYAFTWAGGGPAQTYTVKSKREDGWILVDVADENTNPASFVPGDFPTRWLNVSTAISVQEMRPHQ